MSAVLQFSNNVEVENTKQTGSATFVSWQYIILYLCTIFFQKIMPLASDKFNPENGTILAISTIRIKQLLCVCVSVVCMSV